MRNSTVPRGLRRRELPSRTVAERKKCGVSGDVPQPMLRQLDRLPNRMYGPSENQPMWKMMRATYVLAERALPAYLSKFSRHDFHPPATVWLPGGIWARAWRARTPGRRERLRAVTSNVMLA